MAASDVEPLNLRQERLALAAQIRRSTGIEIELRVLQFGVTRSLLAAALSDDEGWDVIHLSGHGRAAYLALEQEDGSRDPLGTAELAQLLRPAQRRLRLLFLASCSSAAPTLADVKAWLGLGRPPSDMPSVPARQDPSLAPLAEELSQSLDCAVVAMRGNVSDFFALELIPAFYRAVLRPGTSLAEGFRSALVQLGRPGDGASYGYSSLAIPTLVGRRSFSTILVAARGEKNPAGVTDSGADGEAEAEAGAFPPAARLVGRRGELSRGLAVLALGSGRQGVLFYGMAGAGKSTCALELVALFTGSRRFARRILFRPAAPFETGGDAAEDTGAAELALVAFARNWDRVFPAQPILHALHSERELAGSLGRIRRQLAATPTLVVLDQIEALLYRDAAGDVRWRDPRWGELFTALSQPGPSRLVATSRTLPRELPPGVEPIPLHSLSLEEALLLACSLPNLGIVLAERQVTEIALVRRLLKVVQGHPKLLELADAQLRHPAALTRELDRMDVATAGGEDKLQAFFDGGESAAGEEDFRRELDRWAHFSCQGLPPGSRLAFETLCLVEAEDRTESILARVWPSLHAALGHSPPAPDLSPLWRAPAFSALLDVGSIRWRDGTREVTYSIHPAVAAAIGARAPAGLRTAVDRALASFWRDFLIESLDEESSSPAGIVRITRAGRSATPYLVRLGNWDSAATFLEKVIVRNGAPAALFELIPLLRRICRETAHSSEGPDNLAILGKALFLAGRRAQAEAVLREAVAQAEVKGRHQARSAALSDLANLLNLEGRSAEGLEAIAGARRATAEAALGPMTVRLEEATRLQLLQRQGRSREVLQSVSEMFLDLSQQEPYARSEAVTGWNVWETLLDTGRSAALKLEEYGLALEMNAKIQESMVARGAFAQELARARFNDYGPLSRMGRVEEARQVAERSRLVFESAGNWQFLGSALSALADLEDELGHPRKALAYEKEAVRLFYLVDSEEDCALSHISLAHLFQKMGSPKQELAHRVAGLLILHLRDSERLERLLPALGRSSEPALRHSAEVLQLEALKRRVDQLPGCRFRDLFRSLCARRRAPGILVLAHLLSRAPGLKWRPTGAMASLLDREARLQVLQILKVGALEGHIDVTQLKKTLAALQGQGMEEIHEKLVDDLQRGIDRVQAEYPDAGPEDSPDRR